METVPNSEGPTQPLRLNHSTPPTLLEPNARVRNKARGQQSQRELIRPSTSRHQGRSCSPQGIPRNVQRRRLHESPHGPPSNTRLCIRLLQGNKWIGRHGWVFSHIGKSLAVQIPRSRGKQSTHLEQLTRVHGNGGNNLD